MKISAFALRNSREILRDKLNLAFGLGFPLIVLLLLSAIQANIPVELFAIDHITPGIAVFGLSFISLFSGMLIAKDRTSSFMLRLYISPMKSSDFILGYTLPLLPMAVMQTIICFIAAIALGLTISMNILLAIIVLIPSAVLFIAIGLLCGSIFNDRQVGGICGALLTNLSAWLSGTWFDLSLVGGTFKKIAELLPFSHAVDAGRAAMAGQFDMIIPHLIWVIGYAAVILVLAIYAFTVKAKSDNK
ncbi:MAG: ABC transporter permease [Clostridia bacterium]|jgi:ABC-2 type transport system permease protein|nr:ABC transporter permease [Clostridia bacterium]MDD4502492.1 ABC transporter permease [Clostridia bacterium]NLV33139.1 ABC transporter permease [Clostridiaceae bacterium]